MQELLIRFVFGAAAIFALPLCASRAAAQVPTPGYVFVDVVDEAKKPVEGAAVIIYDHKGNELNSALTDPAGRVELSRRHSYTPDQMIIRVIKPRYQVAEELLEGNSGYWSNLNITIKLVRTAKRPASQQKSKRKRARSP